MEIEDHANKNALPEKLVQLLEKANLLSPIDILTTSKEFFRIRGATDNEIDQIKRFYAKTSFRGFETVKNCTKVWPNKWKRITFGCKSLDGLTLNGISTQGITEISGESGSGKTQLCLQLSLTVQLPEILGGLSKGAVFICTEDVFPSKRLAEMIDGFRKRYENEKLNIDFDSNIFIQHISDSNRLLFCVTQQLNQLLSMKSIGLIVIDSIGAIFRTETNFVARALNMRELANALHNLSDKFGCAVVCINQVTSLINDDSLSTEKLIPCLGLAWANLVSTRIQIHRTNTICDITNQSSSNDSNATSIIREMEILFSPELPQKRASFVVTADGIQNVPLAT